MYSITVRNNILIAHSLPGEVFGPAQNMHGATYIVDAEFFAEKVNKYNIIMDLGVVTDILSEVLKFYSYKNLDEVDEFKGIIEASEGRSIELEEVERFAFYERAKTAQCIVSTGESALYRVIATDDIAGPTWEI